MSHTKRAYNLPDFPVSEWKLGIGWTPWWHQYPYMHFKCSREEKVSKWKRLQAAYELRKDLKNYRLKNTFLGIYI